MTSPPAVPRWSALSDEVRTAALLVAGLAVVGAILGVVWEWWSPPGPPGGVLPAGVIQVNESESFVGADGRFAILTIGVGVLVGVAMWFVRRVRGPMVVLGLALGGLLGAFITSQVGHLARGDLKHYPVRSLIDHLPLVVHLSGLLFFEAAAAVLVYSVCAAFAVHDDLGRPEVVSVAAEAGLQQPAGEHAGLYGDGAGFTQQDAFPAQQPGDGAQP